MLQGKIRAIGIENAKVRLLRGRLPGGSSKDRGAEPRPCMEAGPAGVWGQCGWTRGQGQREARSHGRLAFGLVQTVKYCSVSGGATGPVSGIAALSCLLTEGCAPQVKSGKDREGRPGRPGTRTGGF